MQEASFADRVQKHRLAVKPYADVHYNRWPRRGLLRILVDMSTRCFYNFPVLHVNK